MKLTFTVLSLIELEDYIHRGMFLYRKNCFSFYFYFHFIFSCDGTIKSIEKPLESSEFTVVLQHENEIEALFADEDLTFYCGKKTFIKNKDKA
jgi:hypothetical protein